MEQKILTKLGKLEIAIGELQKAVIAIVANMVTKDDLKNELTRFATKDDLMTVKDEVLAKTLIIDQKVDKVDLKVDTLGQKVDKLDQKIDKVDQMQMDILETVQERKADRDDIVDLKIRLDQVESQLAS